LAYRYFLDLCTLLWRGEAIWLHYVAWLSCVWSIPSWQTIAATRLLQESTRYEGSIDILVLRWW